jgi:hypothetical protein
MHPAFGCHCESIQEAHRLCIGYAVSRSSPKSASRENSAAGAVGASHAKDYVALLAESLEHAAGLSDRDVERMHAELKMCPPPDDDFAWTNRRSGESV